MGKFNLDDCEIDQLNDAGDNVIAASPADGATMFITSRQLSAAEHARLHEAVRDTFRGNRPLVVGEGIRVYQAVGGNWVEIGGEPAPKKPAPVQPLRYVKGGELPFSAPTLWAAAIALGISLVALLLSVMFLRSLSLP